MKILSATQIRALDAFTIKNEPIASIDLMERASETFVEWFVEKFPRKDNPIYIFCGPGNNGGDGLAVGRLLLELFYDVHIFLCRISKELSTDCQKNLERLTFRNPAIVQPIQKGEAFPQIKTSSTIIDAIFGSGLNRPVEGYWGDLIDHLNRSEATRISIDTPSGFFADEHSAGIIYEADYTLSFEFPKLGFLFPENHQYVGNWEYRSIQLSPIFIEKESCKYYLIDSNLAKTFLKTRQKFDHKGSYGHSLLIVGSYGKIGAATLAAKACLRTGSGLVTIHLPKIAYNIIQISVPEAMVSIDKDLNYFSEPPEMKPFRAIGIGCGLDQKEKTQTALFTLLKGSTIPLVLDADALNILGQNPAWLNFLPKGSILTPHPKEFERLFGKSEHDFDCNRLQIEKAKEYGIFIILKGAHTAIVTPEGNCYFNSTGNPGMATAGSGDVLTGIITGLLSQSYSSFAACVLGVYLHGLAGDLAAKKIGQEALIASDIISNIGAAFKELKNKKNS